MGEGAEERIRQHELEIQIREIARVCHEVNRVLTEYAKDVPVQLPWDCIDEDMRASGISGVRFAIENQNATPEQQHEAWMRERLAAGWVYGPVKDSEKKTHPALRSYSELPPETRLKDAVFRAIVWAMGPEEP